MPPTTLDELLATARTAKQTRPPHRDVNITFDQAVAEQVEALEQRIADLEQQQVDVASQAEDDLLEAGRDARMASPVQDDIGKTRDENLERITSEIEKATEELAGLMEGTTLTLRFTQIPGQAWAEMGARNPPRVGVTLDAVYGYNYHAVAMAAAKYQQPGPIPGTFTRGFADLVRDPADDASEPTVEPISPEQMDSILEVISGHEFERIADGIWQLNDYGPQQRIARAGKASRADSASRSS